MPALQAHTEHKTALQLLFNHYLRTGERLIGEAAVAFLEHKANVAPDQPAGQKSAESVLFEHYLRAGERLYGEAAEKFLERKFNRRHREDNGQFARVGEGRYFGDGGQSNGGFRNGDGSIGKTTRVPSVAPNNPSQVRPSPTPKSDADPVAKRQRNIGELAAKYESRKLEGPGTISSGRNDPGGVSYGTFQLSSTRRRVHDFVASEEAGAWSVQFRGKQPATRQFDEAWRSIAASDPEGFEAAQRAFIVRTNYSDGARQVRQVSGYELERAHPAVRQAFFSTTVQHGPTGGSELFLKSVKFVSKNLKRDDSGYDSALINSLYDRRTQQRRHFAAASRLKAAQLTREGKIGEANDLLGKARLADNDVRRRYPRERYDALLLLSGQPMSGL